MALKTFCGVQVGEDVDVVVKDVRIGVSVVGDLCLFLPSLIVFDFSLQTKLLTFLCSLPFPLCAGGAQFVRKSFFFGDY